MFTPRMTISPTWSAPGRERPIVLVPDLHLDAPDRLADAVDLALGGADVEGRRGGRLGQPVALEDHDPELLLEGVDDLGGDRCAAGDPDAQLRHVVVGEAGVVQQRDVHRRDALEHGDAVALHDLEHLGGVEPRHQRHRRSEPNAHIQLAGQARRRGTAAAPPGRRRRRGCRTPDPGCRRSCTAGSGSARRPSGCPWCRTCRR